MISPLQFMLQHPIYLPLRNKIAAEHLFYEDIILYYGILGLQDWLILITMLLFLHMRVHNFWCYFLYLFNFVLLLNEVLRLGVLLDGSEELHGINPKDFRFGGFADRASRIVGHFNHIFISNDRPFMKKIGVLNDLSSFLIP